MNNRGWIKIFEAFVAVLLVIGVLLIVINQGYIEKKDISSQVYDEEIAILREIQLDNNLRNEILGVGNLPAEWEDIPSSIKTKITDRTSSYLVCEAKICEIGHTCKLEEYPEKDVYAQSVFITATLETEEIKYRQLKLFCWPSEN